MTPEDIEKYFGEKGQHIDPHALPPGASFVELGLPPTPNLQNMNVSEVHPLEPAARALAAAQILISNREDTAEAESVVQTIMQDAYQKYQDDRE